MKSPPSLEPEFPPGLVDEAACHPGGWVYEIDGRYDRDGAIPPHAVRRGWRIDADGKPTGEYQDNPSFGNRKPLTNVEQVIADVRALASEHRLQILVADDLALSGQPVAFDVGIAMIVDAVLAQGFMPADPWMHRIENGRAYDFVRDS